MLEHLSNPEYVHVLLNPLPVYGLAMGVLGLIIALLTRARAARVTALAIIFICALSAWPVAHYGEAGYDRVLSMSDSEGSKWLEEHSRRADKLIYLFYALAALAAVSLVAEWKFQKAVVPLAIATLLLGAASLAAGAYIGYAGGHIRHREFRFEPAPAQPVKDDHQG